MHAKRTNFAHLEKVISFVFKYFLALFPRFLYFLATRWIPPPGRSRPRPSFPFEAPTKTDEVSESSSLMRELRVSALNRTSFWVRFSFVFDVASFVFNKILASVVFFLFLLIPAHHGSPGPSRFSLLVPTFRRSPCDKTSQVRPRK